MAKIEEPIAKGLAVEGAMSSLAIAVAGLLTVVIASVFAGFM